MNDHSSFNHNSPKLEIAICPSTGDWTNKLRYINTMKYYSALIRWVNLRDIMLSGGKKLDTRLYIVQLYFCEILEQTKLIPGDRHKKVR